MSNEKLHNLYLEENIRVTRVIKTMRLGWTGHVAHMEEKMMI